jgi:hypothetical protein
MASVPRLLAIMGSGETAPTMVKVHRALLDRMAKAGGGGPVSAVLLDTPYGFQENADQLSARAVDYFRQSVGHEFEVAQYRSAANDPVARERAMAQIRAATYVFAGPGSPTYALAQWADSPVPELLRAKLDDGGCVTFASAAALTLGRFTVPVYEIYKVGATPAWADGLDLLAPFGLDVAVIPHYDNAEGGTHDTRYCYLGERRLRMLESELTDGAFVLGVDEHTAAIIDLDDKTLTVEGNGAVYARRDGVTASFASGSVVGLDELHDAGAHPDRPTDRSAPTAAAATAPSGPAAAGAAPIGLLASAQRLHDEFGAAVDAGGVDEAVAAVLGVEQLLVDWAADPLQSDEPDRARALLREMVVRLGDLARVGAGDPRDAIGPFVDAVLSARDAARSARDWDTADSLRDRLLAAGVEIHDSPDGTTWELRAPTAG